MSSTEWWRVDQTCCNSYWVTHPSVYYKGEYIRASIGVYGDRDLINRKMDEIKKKMKGLGYEYFRSTKLKPTALGNDVLRITLFFRKPRGNK